MAERRPWIRLYTHVPDDPKAQRLPDAIFKFWINCMCLAGRHNGFLPEVDDIAFHLRLSADTVKGHLKHLKTAELIDESEQGIRMHDWDSWQYEDRSAKRTKEYRDRRKEKRVKLSDGACDGISDGHVTEQCNDDVTLTVTDFSSVSVSVSDSLILKAEEKTMSRAPEKKPGAVSGSFRNFWDRWCKLTGRKQRESYACQAWLSVVEFETEAVALACLERYGASDEVKRGIVTNADKWLFEQSQDSWRGEWQARAPVNGIVSEMEKYLNEH